jgi:hypothetical protein
MATALKIARQRVSSDAQSLYLQDKTVYSDQARADLALIVYGTKMLFGKPDTDTTIVPYDVFATGPYEATGDDEAGENFIEATLTGDALYRFHAVLLEKLSSVNPLTGNSLVGSLFYDSVYDTPVVITGATQDPETMLYTYSSAAATRKMVLDNVAKAHADYIYYEMVVYGGCLELERLIHAAMTDTCSDRKLFMDKGQEIQWLMDSAAVFFEQKYYPKVVELIDTITSFVGHCKKACRC